MPTRLILIREGDFDQIFYQYDAAGNKLCKQATKSGNIVKTTRYFPTFETENKRLKHIFTAEGKAVPMKKGFEYQYFLKDHLGNTRVVLSQTGKVLQQNSYYPFGMLMAGLPQKEEANTNKYLYNGKELQADFGLDWYDYGARFYDVEVGRFHTVDPLSEDFSFQSPYAYAENNPISFIDMNGENASPYFDMNGNFLGVDENGFKGKIYVTTEETFHKNSENGVANSKSIQESSETRSLRASYVSDVGQAKIANKVLSHSTDFETGKLQNNSVSIFNGVIKDGVPQGVNNPIIAERLKTGSVNGKINVTALTGEINSLGSVEAIQNYIGVHELNGHGIKGYSGGSEPGGTHYKAYLDQLSHSTFKSLTKSQQMEIQYRAGEYMYRENIKLYNYNMKNNTLFYKNYYKAYYFINNK